MGNLFYNVVSFIVGVLVTMYTVLNWKSIKVIFKSLLVVFASMFMVLGVLGFFIPEEYSVFLIVGILFLCIASVATLVVSNKWNEAAKNNEKNNQL